MTNNTAEKWWKSLPLNNRIKLWKQYDISATSIQNIPITEIEKMFQIEVIDKYAPAKSI